MQSRRWCWTLNNYGDDIADVLEQIDATYMVFGRECGESGTKHLQGYFVLPRKKQLGGVKKLIPGAHFEIARGTHKEASDYCKKDGDFLERGTYEESQKVVWSEIRDLIKKGDMDTIADKYPREWCMYGDKWAKRVEWVHEKNIDPDNLWIYGPSGCGKTRWVLETYPDVYHFQYKKGWWDSYRGQEVVLIDDFDPYFKPAMIHDFKRWWDRYEFPVSIKGCADKMIRPKRFIVTSNHSIEECFGRYEKDYPAIARRFSVKDMNTYITPFKGAIFK